MKNIVLAATIAIASAASAQAATIIDNSTLGFYNQGLGRSLDGGASGFPQVSPFTDPRITYAADEEPDLSSAAAELGSWLSAPATPGGTWSSAEQSVPRNWTVHDETAIIYAFDAGTTGLTDLHLSAGVDNGIFVWLNGVFQGGSMAPGGAHLGEFTLDLGTVKAGTNYLQILREDHGGGTGYAIEVTGEAISAVPLPAGLPMLLAGLGIFGWMKRRSA